MKEHFIVLRDIGHYPQPKWRGENDPRDPNYVVIPRGTIVTNVRKVRDPSRDAYLFTVPKGSNLLFRDFGTPNLRPDVSTEDIEASTDLDLALGEHTGSNLEQIKLCWGLDKQVESLKATLLAQWKRVATVDKPVSIIELKDKRGDIVKVIATKRGWSAKWPDGSGTISGTDCTDEVSQMTHALNWLKIMGHWDGDAAATATTASAES